MRKLFVMLSWLVTLLMPVVLIMGAVRIVINHWYLDFEYNTPGFPDDPFGFTKQDRLTYSRIAVDYLINDAGIEFLGDLQFPPGEQVPEPSCSYMDDCTYLYNERELKHMVDVKVVLGSLLDVWVVVLVVVVLLGVWAWRGRWMFDYLRGLSRGGLFTLILIGTILALVLVTFRWFFVFFHNVFFEEGTWMFFFSDTLIRLFPERFWRDTFLTVGGLAVLLSLLVWWAARRISTRVTIQPRPETSG